MNQAKIAVATSVPTSWAAIKNGASSDLMPVKVSVSEGVIVTAGLAKEGEEVN